MGPGLDWKNSHLLAERLASLGIMGAQLRGPLKPLCCDVQGGPQFFPHDAERR